MSISLEKLCRKAKQLYKMELVAGKNGLDNIVKWVHIIEEFEVSNYLKGNELVFTTGIGNVFKNEKSAMLFLKNLIKSDACGLVVNLGPYITYLPDQMVAYCNEVNFPLFFVPWDIKLVDITRDFCEQIVKDETKESSLKSNIKDYIFYPQERERLLPVLEREGFGRDLHYCVITFGMQNDVNRHFTEATKTKFEFLIKRETKKIVEKPITFWYDHIYIVIVAELSKQQIRDFTTRIQNKVIETREIIIGVGNFTDNLLQLPFNFNCALSIYRMCEKTSKRVMFYEDAGIYKILLSVTNKNVLQNYIKETVGTLIKFDEDNGTDYYPFLVTFVENNASVKKTSDQCFIHRNTVNYKIGKINQILNCDITDLDVLVGIKLCMLISNI